jgi:transposase
MKKAKKKKTRHGVRYSAEIRAEAVKLLRDSDKTVAEVSALLGVGATTLERWMRQVAIDEGHGPEGALTTEERRELRALRQEVKELKTANTILKKVEAFSAARKR